MPVCSSKSWAASVDYRALEDQRRAATRPEAPTVPGSLPSTSNPISDAGRSPNGQSGPAFVLAGVRLSGNTVFSESELAAGYASHIGASISLGDLITISDAITARYRAAGYFLSRAYVPVQDVVNGQVEIRVVEGRIVDVEFMSDTPVGERLAPFATAIKAEQPLRLATIERQLLLVAQISGFQINETTIDEVGDFSGDFRLRIEAPFDRLSAQMSADTSGTRNVGRLLGSADVRLNGLFSERGSLGMSLGGVPNDPHEWVYGSLTYDVMIAPGFWLGGRVSRGALHPDGEDRLVSARENYWNAGIAASFLALLSRDHLLRFDARLSADNVNGDDASGPTKRDRNRAVALSATAYHALPGDGALTATVELEQGLQGLGASRAGAASLSRADGEPDATRLSGNLGWTQPLFGPVSMAFAAAAQTTSAPVLASREFYLGGTLFGRGYGPGALSGDGGAAASGELRFTRGIDLGWLETFQLYGYYDVGAVWEKGPGGRRTSLASAGGGLRLFFMEDLELAIEIGVPLTYSEYLDGSHPVRANLFIAKSF